MNRRQFLQATAGVAAAHILARRAYAAFAQSPPLKKFVQPLRSLAEMAPATKVRESRVPGCTPFDYYEIALRQYTDRLHPDLPATRLRGYGNLASSSSDHRHLGGAIIANKGVAVRIKFVNELPATHFLPVDNTVPGLSATAKASPNRAAVHLHGGNVPWSSDGGPHHWFTPGGGPVGESHLKWLPDTTGATTADSWFPNVNESARLMWYHDHAVGNTRLNAYAGLASGYIVRDSVEAGLIASGAIPQLEIPLVVQDKIFTSSATADNLSAPGDLWYPRTYDTDFFDLEPGGLPLPPYSLVPEFWGDTMLVNGTVYPYVNVEARRYRLRMLNACNTRFLSLKLVGAQGPNFPASTEPNLAAAGPQFLLIGTEGGFLDGSVFPQGAVFSNTPTARPLVLAPAERADIIIDFSNAAPGSLFILHNDAPVPFPAGTPMADFFPGNPNLTSPPAAGYGPNTRTLLQFRVVTASATDPARPATWSLPRTEFRGIFPGGPGRAFRDLTLNEAVDEYGRLSQLLGNGAAGANGMFGLPYDSPATETPKAGDIEFWRISNLSADTHPIHFHLANVRVLSRQPINVARYNGRPTFRGAVRPPDPEERGWKETVRMNPGEAILVGMKFDLPPNPVVPVNNAPTPVTVPQSPRTGGYEYVWHCHILEHEEHDMMRPLIVTP